jgi:outer membrane receptor protein involved in Fe transport
MNAPKFGNPNLTNATINNIDIRYEIYPRKGEVASIGGFYKTFQNPIESVLLNFNENRGFGYQNAESARSYGVEVEFKKSFKDFIKVPFIEDLAINLNAAYIFSEVDLGATAGGFQDRTRPMQGQSPYIVNANLEYTNDKGWTSNLIYNRFGSRIFAVGSNNAATIYEAARDQLDFSISKAFKKINLKLAVQNILDAKFNFFDDTNNNYRVDNTDVLTSSFQRGILFNLGLTYDF